jgi:hypothetical protein
MNIGIGVINEEKIVYTNEMFVKHYNDIFHRDFDANSQQNNPELFEVLKGLHSFKSQMNKCINIILLIRRIYKYSSSSTDRISTSKPGL